MAEVCQRVLDEFGMPVERAVGIMVPIFKGWMIAGTVAAIEM